MTAARRFGSPGRDKRAPPGPWGHPLRLVVAAAALCLPLAPSFCQGWTGLSENSPAGPDRSRVVRQADFNFKMQRLRRKIRPGPTRTSEPKTRSTVEIVNAPHEPTEEELALNSYVDKIQLCEEVQEVSGLMSEMKEQGLPLAMDVWKASLGVCVNASAGEAARTFLQDMTKERQTPDHECYHLAMDAGMRDPGAPDDYVELLFNEMQMRGLMPTQDSYTKVIRSYILRDNEQLARRTFREATRKGLLTCWENRGLVLQLAGFPLDVATFILRVAVIDRANELAGRRKAGKTTMHVLTRPPGRTRVQTEGGLLEREVLDILRKEFGLKAKAEPSDFGRIRIRGSELERFGLERREQRQRQKVQQ